VPYAEILNGDNAPPFITIPDINEEDKIRFQMYVDRWTLFSKDLHRDAEREEFLGNFEKSNENRNRAYVYDALIDYMKLLIS